MLAQAPQNVQDITSVPRTPRRGLVVSGAMHLGLLAALAFGFTQAPPFTDATESIPVETITSTQLNEIMQGEKDAKPAPAPSKPAPQAKPAPEPPPVPPTRPEPPKEPEPPPPEPPKRPEPPKPGPPKAEPPKPEPPKAEPPKPEPPKPEPPAPEPPRRPDPPKPPAEDAPSPPTRPRPEKVEETPRPPERPRPVRTEEPKPAFKPDDIAKALAKEKAESKPETKPKNAFDPNAISKLIGTSKTAELSPKPPAQGLPNHQAARMSVSLENGLNEWFRDSYKNCWTLPPSNPTGENYVFDVRVTFNPDGSLSGRPVMINPPHDPEWRAHADSVMRAVMRCNPLRVPAQYAPFFEQWRSKTIHFDPSSAEG